ncbi:hypothetical protein [Mycolicibacterium peregrinum]|nr:hypothetical protein [Mycolicibacterium peregrinum]
MPQAITEHTTVVLPNEPMSSQQLHQLVFAAVAEQLDGSGKKLIRVHPSTGTAMPGNDHLMRWSVTYECWPADDSRSGEK